MSVINIIYRYIVSHWILCSVLYLGVLGLSLWAWKLLCEYNDKTYIMEFYLRLNEDIENKNEIDEIEN